jgi:hypothetical protein
LIGKPQLRENNTLPGIGFYYASKLTSKKAVVGLNGPAQATLCVSDELDATITGPGRVEYYSAPRVRQNGFPFSSLVHLGAIPPP